MRSFSTKIYPLIFLLLACSGTSKYERWREGNWALYNSGSEKILFRVKEAKGDRFYLEMEGNGYKILAVVNHGEVDSIISQEEGLILDFIALKSQKSQYKEIKDTIVAGKNIVLKRLNDSTSVSPDVPIFGIIKCGDISLLDFGYRNPPPYENFLDE